MRQRLYHPKYGAARSKVKGYVNYRGVAYVRATWGSFLLVATVPLMECEIRNG